MRAIPTAVLLTLPLLGLPSFAQSFGSAENLAPYIPTPQRLVERMLEAGHVKRGDVVYDLGSGDGRIVITAAQKFGARAVGVEIRPDLYEMAVERIKALGLEDKVTMIHGSALRVDLSPANVVTMYLLTSSNERLKPNLEKYLKPGSRVVSNEFPIKGWKPAEVVHEKLGSMDHTIYVYEMGRTK
ncbi:MAG TPA: methyltransferase domain-containing protein [Bryobacteraceae bacterium]|nr:methyltransferase domain-containing protein [Bryobacteraceae bacterium]